jgi:hypothetical protein
MNWKIEIESPTKQGTSKRGAARPIGFWSSSSSSFSLDLSDGLYRFGVALLSFGVASSGS